MADETTSAEEQPEDEPSRDDSPVEQPEADEPEQEGLPEEDSEQDEAEEKLEQTNQFWEILPPRGDEESQRLLELWFRTWSFEEGDALACYMLYDPEAGKLVSHRVFMGSGPEQLESFNPRMEPTEFERRLMARDMSQQAAPQSLLNEYKGRLEEEFFLEGFTQPFYETVLEQQSEWFRDMFEEYLQRVFEGAKPVFQVRGQIITQEVIESGRVSGEDFEAFEDEAEGSAEEVDGRADGDSGERNLPDPDEVEPMIKTSIVTTPEEGIPVPDLQRGDEVQVRVVGPPVENLPDDLVEPERQRPATIPLDAVVLNVDSLSEPPEDFQGDPEDYRRILVRIGGEIDGEALCYHEERVKTPDAEATEEEKQDILMALLTIVGSLVFLALVIWFIN